MSAHIFRLVSRTVLAHVAVLVEVAKRRKAEKRRFDTSPLAHPEKRGWKARELDDIAKDVDTLRNMRAVSVPESGRHSRGSAA